MNEIKEKSPGEVIYREPMKFAAMDHEEGEEVEGEFNLLYLGQNGQEFQIGYREYRNNSIRKSFSKNYIYQVNNEGATEITFRGITINVISVSNMLIKYEVPLT